jgi:hypothetical protein
VSFGSCGSEGGRDLIGDDWEEESAELYNRALVRPRPESTMAIKTYEGRPPIGFLPLFQGGWVERGYV